VLGATSSEGFSSERERERQMTESCGYRPLGRRRQENAVRLGAILIATNSSPYRLVNTSTMIDIEFVSGHHILTVYHVLFSGEAGEAVLRGKS